jgi:uncharacterized protein (DUF1810 family)
MTDLDRFLTAQTDHYQTALAELRRGRKQSHWIWYVLPQLRGLGRSDVATRFGIADLQEARDYVAHPILGDRLRECIRTIHSHTGTTANQILGDIDAMKFRSCLTLFALAAPEEPLFRAALDHFYAGHADPMTLSALGQELPGS